MGPWNNLLGKAPSTPVEASANSLSHPTDPSVDMMQQLTGRLSYQFRQAKSNEESYVVPRRSHFIWIGSVIPVRYVANVARFASLNPSYEVNLWVDHLTPAIAGVHIRQVDLANLRNAAEYAHERNCGARADILRYEIISTHGGVYLDVDCIAMKPFDDLFLSSFVTYALHPWNNVTNAMFGFPAKSFFLDFLIRCLCENFTRGLADVVERTGPTFFTTCFVQYGDANIRMIPQSIALSYDPSVRGPVPGGYIIHTCDKNW